MPGFDRTVRAMDPLEPEAILLDFVAVTSSIIFITAGMAPSSSVAEGLFDFRLFSAVVAAAPACFAANDGGSSRTSSYSRRIFVVRCTVSLYKLQMISNAACEEV